MAVPWEIPLHSCTWQDLNTSPWLFLSKACLGIGPFLGLGPWPSIAIFWSSPIHHRIWGFFTNEGLPGPLALAQIRALPFGLQPYLRTCRFQDLPKFHSQRDAWTFRLRKASVLGPCMGASFRYSYIAGRPEVLNEGMLWPPPSDGTFLYTPVQCKHAQAIGPPFAVSYPSLNNSSVPASWPSNDSFLTTRVPCWL